MNILVTGSAGFIGFHTSKKLLERGDTVVGLDNFNQYYDAKLKEDRTKQLQQYPNFTLVRGDITNKDDIRSALAKLDTSAETRIIHLAAQAGVRHSVENPDVFITDNIQGFQNILDCAREYKIGGVIYASSSSVYGNNESYPSRETDTINKPVSLYGLTKASNELQAYSAHHLFGTKSTGLRFFTVYGPWGRPDMALFLFTRWALEGTPLKIFGEGKMQRDFTYIDDIVAGIISAADHNYDYEIFNLGAGNTEELMSYVQAVEGALGIEAEKEFLPMQFGDTVKSMADITKAEQMLQFAPTTHIAQGVPKFVEWYRSYYNI
jgi:UDP-glucuronate 4-epimerase